MPSKKLISTIFLFLFFSSVLPLNAATPQSFNDKFVGVNSIHLTDNFTTEKVDESLIWLAEQCGVSVIRLFLPYTDYPSLSNLKYALQKGSEYGIKFIITLGDSFLLPDTHSLNFYHNDLETYKQRARDTINELKSEYGSAIFAWELINEPHCDYGPIKIDADGNSTREYDPTCFRRLYDFVRDFSAEIKQLDPTHPVTIGLIGKHGDGRTSVWSKFDPKTGPYAGSDFVALNNISTIDAAENHVYSVSLETIRKDIDKANYLNKPFFVEEYGPDGINKSKAEQLREKMQGSFDYGANGFLVWDYSPPGNDGGQFTFNQNSNNSLCQILKDESTLQDALPKKYDLGPLGPLSPQPFTPSADCLLESTNFPPIKITKADPSHPGEAQQPWGGGKHPDQYPPSQDQDDQYVTLCTYQATASQQYSANKDPDTGEVIPYTATEVRQQIEEDQYASLFSRDLTTYFKPITNPDRIENSVNSFGDERVSAAYKMTSAADQKKIRNNLISQAKNGQILDEQIAWSCDSGCYTLNCGKPDNSCQTVYLSQDSHSCHQLAYPYLNLTTSGSLNSKINISNDDGTKTVDHMLPNAAIHLNTSVAQQAISARQKSPPSKICQTVRRPPIQDTTNPVKFIFFKFVSDLITGDKKVTAPVEITEEHHPQLQEGIETQTIFAAGFVPAKYQEPEDSPGAGTSSEVGLRSLGGGHPQNIFKTFVDSLKPSSWNTQPL